MVTFEVTRRAILPPSDTSQYVVPVKMSRDVRRYLGTSPFIETRHPQIRSSAKEATEGKENAWEKVEAIYDWVREHVEYKDGALKGALAALRDGNGDCEELSSLFIAMCRVSGIPARTVWLPGHCYPEFYLEDKEGHGRWFPCQAAGTRDFGGMSEFRPILQKGDNFRVPEQKEPQRYVAELLKVKVAPRQPAQARIHCRIAARELSGESTERDRMRRVVRLPDTRSGDDSCATVCSRNQLPIQSDPPRLQAVLLRMRSSSRGIRVAPQHGLERWSVRRYGQRIPFQTVAHRSSSTVHVR